MSALSQNLDDTAPTITTDVQPLTATCDCPGCIEHDGRCDTALEEMQDWLVQGAGYSCAGCTPMMLELGNSVLADSDPDLYPIVGVSHYLPGAPLPTFTPTA